MHRSPPPSPPRGALRPWHGTNLVGVSPWLLASPAFQRAPCPLHIAGTREAHAHLFQCLARCDHQEDASAFFVAHMARVFEADGDTLTAPEHPYPYADTYLDLLRGWGFDASSAQGAVLKGWVESRFGLLPTYHHEPLLTEDSPAWHRYLAARMDHRFHHRTVSFQLDILYEYCQWSLGRFGLVGSQPPFVTLWRGCQDCESQRQGVENLETGPPGARHWIIRLNNLVSFTQCRERAEEFGDWVLEARVPLAKILYFSGLLGRLALPSEGECLVIGGDFPVRVSRGAR